MYGSSKFADSILLKMSRVAGNLTNPLHTIMKLYDIMKIKLNYKRQIIIIYMLSCQPYIKGYHVDLAISCSLVKNKIKL